MFWFWVVGLVNVVFKIPKKTNSYNAVCFFLLACLLFVCLSVCLLQTGCFCVLLVCVFAVIVFCVILIQVSLVEQG